MFLSVLVHVTKAAFLFCFLDVFKRTDNSFEETFFLLLSLSSQCFSPVLCFIWQGCMVREHAITAVVICFLIKINQKTPLHCHHSKINFFIWDSQQLKILIWCFCVLLFVYVITDVFYVVICWCPVLFNTFSSNSVSNVSQGYDQISVMHLYNDEK